MYQVNKTHILAMLWRFSLAFCMLRDLAIRTKHIKDFSFNAKIRKNVNVQCFNFQYRKGTNQIKLAQLGALEYTLFSLFRGLNMEKILSDVLDIGWVYHLATFNFLIPHVTYLFYSNSVRMELTLKAINILLKQNFVRLISQTLIF